MNNLWVTIMIILGVVMIITCICSCKMITKEYERIRTLIEPVTPIRNNAVHPIPVATGVRVYVIDENIQVININE